MRSSACRMVTFFNSPMNDAPAIAGSGTTLNDVPRTSRRRRSVIGTGCANVSANARLSRSAAEVGDELFALQVAERILQLHQLNEQIVLRVQAWRVNRALEIERQPLLDAVHAGALGEIQEQGHIEHDRRRQYAVPAEKVDLE